MTITVLGTTMISDQNPCTAWQAPERNGWEVSWLPGQILDRSTAISAMLLAGHATQADLREGHWLWPHMQCQSAGLGLTAPDANTRASELPEKTSDQEPAISRAAPEAGL